MDHTLDFLREQQVDRELIQEVEAFRSRYPVEEEEKNRVSQPDMPFYGKEVLEMGIAAVLQGENILLTGAKATGKISWQKIWHGFLGGLSIMFLFM